ncbi:hypothetical protein IM774_11320 [Erysipelotrichaceae bacterium RD49]|nr:hypothetical protein [Erysipelotrichaceae bacterium RD49]
MAIQEAIAKVNMSHFQQIPGFRNTVLNRMVTNHATNTHSVVEDKAVLAYWKQLAIEEQLSILKCLKNKRAQKIVQACTWADIDYQRELKELSHKDSCDIIKAMLDTDLFDQFLTNCIDVLADNQRLEMYRSVVRAKNIPKYIKRFEEYNIQMANSHYRRYSKNDEELLDMSPANATEIISCIRNAFELDEECGGTMPIYLDALEFWAQLMTDAAVEVGLKDSERDFFLEQADEELRCTELCFDHNCLYSYPEYSDQDILADLQSNPRYKEAWRRWNTLKQTLVPKLASQPALPDQYSKARSMFRRVVIHVGMTNSGKTYQAIQALKSAETGIYCAPLRLLAAQAYTDLQESGLHASLITGEEQNIDNQATHVSSTVEMSDLDFVYDVAVIDECQMIFDLDRGGYWTEAILGLQAHELHLCTAPEGLQTLVSLIESCKDSFEIVEHERMTPLIQQPSPGLDHPQPGDAYIVFSKSAVFAVAAELEEKGFICAKLFGSLPYETKQLEAKRFSSGQAPVLVATDCIGMGMNLPIERIVFLESEKYDGHSRRSLYPSEIAQVAGRAGRYGIYENGIFCLPHQSKGQKKKLREYLKRKSDNSKLPVVGPPRFLYAMPGRLSEKLELWKMESKIDSAFVQQNVSEDILKAKEAEQYLENENLAAVFSTMTFNFENPVLHEYWIALMKAGIGKDIQTMRPEHYRRYENALSHNNIENLTTLFALWDLYSQYARMSESTSEQEYAQYKRHEIAYTVADLLLQPSEGRTCKYCGKKLSWDYPYGMCQECHDEIYGPTPEDDDDDDDFDDEPDWW